MTSYELLKSVVSLFLEITDKPNHLIQTEKITPWLFVERQIIIIVRGLSGN